MKRIDIEKAFARLPELPVDSGRLQRGLTLALGGAVRGSSVRGEKSSSSLDLDSLRPIYYLSDKDCNCADGAAPRDQNSVKLCKHRIAWLIVQEVRKATALLAATFVSDNGRGAHFVVADEADDKLHDVYLKRQERRFTAICECGRQPCQEKGVCRHVRAAVRRYAARAGFTLAWTPDNGTATRVTKMHAGHRFTVTVGNDTLWAIAWEA